MKLKDYVTLGNLLCGFLSVVMLLRGRVDWACYLIYIGYGFDVCDGLVARLTKQYNEFGANLDSVSDFVTYSIAPSFIIYYVFAVDLRYPWPIAAAIGSVPVVFGTIRHALYAVRPMSYPCYWIGMPRPVFSLFILALLQSTPFRYDWRAPWIYVAHALMIGLIFALGWAHVARFPLVNHQQRRWMTLLRFGRAVFLYGSLVVAPIAVVLRAPWLFFDKLVFDMLIYLGIAWTQIPQTDLARIRHYLKTQEKIPPLCHRSSTWRPRGLAPFFDPGGDAVPPSAPAGEAPEGQHSPALS